MELNLLPLVRRDGQDLLSLPGLYTAGPPRRPARGRQPDFLILYLVSEGFSQEQDPLLARVAQLYYKTPGSVTSALRVAVESLNDILLDRNLHTPSSRQSAGLLAMVVLRGEQLYLAHSGPLHTFLIQAVGVQHLFDPESSGRGLGLGRAVPIRYFQASLKANDTLVISHEPPASWSEATLTSLHGQGPEGLRRRLLKQVGPDLSAILIQAKNGPGQVHVLKPQPVPASSEILEQEDPEASSGTTGLEAAPAPVLITPPPKPVTIGEAGQVRPREAASPVSARPLELPPEPRPAKAETFHAAAQPVIPEVTGPKPSRKPARSNPFVGFARALGSAYIRIAKIGHTLIQRMLPGEGTLPPSVMAFFAIAVPLVVVTIAMVVYFQRGRTAQYQAYYTQAVEAAQQAQAQTDPQARRASWANVIANLDRAEGYQSTSETKALRAQALSVFDELEGIRRIDFQPAIAGGVPASYHITRLVATESDLYLLDSATGNVTRAIPAGQVYQIDGSFQCGPGLPAGQATGQIIDIAPIPKGNELNATLMAMDSEGNVIECIPGAVPVFNSLAPPPTSWGKPVAFTLDMGNLYVLDPKNNAVWVYWGSEFTSQPQFFFSENVPPMQDVIDLAVDKFDLYLLHADGHITLCTFSNLGVSPTRCNDPTPFADSRPGREGQILLPDTPFTQISSTQPPDPSLYLLQPQSRALYHFSLRLLTFQRQLRSQTPLPDSPATAFAIRPDGRVAFLAIGSRVFYGGIP